MEAGWRPIRTLSSLNWLTAAVMVVFHIGAVAALFVPSWEAVIVTAVLYWSTLSIGIGMGYHRLHTHRSYHIPRWLEYAFAVLGTLTLEGGPIFWVATHRLHHQHSDTDQDPHTPRHGGFWAHMGWIIFGEAKHSDTEAMRSHAPDLARDGFYRWLNTYHYVPLVLLGLALLALGGWPLVCWAVFFRVTVGLHSTWLVNSATHMWGSQRFKTRDDSRNSWWVALLTFGEGWHNNHHAHPTSARHGLAPFEIDVTWMQIRLLQWLRIAKAVRVARLPDRARQVQAA